MEESRTQNSVKNVSTALCGHLADVGVGFLARMVLIRTLPVEYLGLNSLFSSILSFLSLLELGVGSAVLLSLYEPVSRDDRPAIRAITALCGRCYRCAGVLMLLFGVILYPFLGKLVGQSAQISGFGICYFLYLLANTIYYWYAHRRFVLIAEQKSRVILARQYLVGAVRSFLQITVLLLWKSYLLYLVCLLAANVVENLLIERELRKRLPWLYEQPMGEVTPAVRAQIRKNTGAMFCHRVGDTAAKAAGSLMTAGIEGMAAAGLYSNYNSISSILSELMTKVYEAALGSVGNLDQECDRAWGKRVFERIAFMGFWAAGWMGICLFFLLTPFMTVFFGKEYQMNDVVALMVSLQFFLNAARRPVLLFRDGLGLFYYDRYKPFAEAALTFLFLWIFGNRYGVAGIAAGNVAALLLTCCWIEPVVLYRKGFQCRVSEYFRMYAGWLLRILAAAILTGAALRSVQAETLPGFAAQALICLLVPNLVFLALTFRREELVYWIDCLMNLLHAAVKRGK